MPADAYQFLLDASARERIQIAKLGSFSDRRYGDFTITAAEVKAWQANLSKLPGGRAPIDFDHKADKPGAARDTEAAGWITGVALDDQTPVATVEWTDKGREAIEAKRYLFISPSYGPWTDEQGTSTADVLQGAALTNKPFLNMAPVVNLARADAFATETDAPEASEDAADSRAVMPDMNPKILEALGLAKDADEAKLLSAITELKTPTQAKSLEAQAADEGKVLLDKAELDSLKAKATGADEITKRLEAVETERADEKFEAAYKETLAEGRVDSTDATKALHREVYDLNAEVGLRNLAALPKIVNTTARGTGGHDGADTPTEIDGFEVDVDKARILEKAEAYAAEHKVDFKAAVAAVQGA